MKKFYLTAFVYCLAFINAFAQCPITVNDATVCMGQSAILTASGATSYVWSNGATGTSTTVAPTSSTPYIVTGTTGGCSSSAIAMVSAFPLPYADFIFSPDPVIVGNPVVTFTDQSSGDVNSWNWDFGDGTPSTLVSPVHTYPSLQTNYVVTLTVSNAGGCENSISREVIIGPLTANFTATYDTLQNNFILNVDPLLNNNAVSYKWNFGDGTTSTQTSPTHTFTKDSVYNICMKIYTSTGDSCQYCYPIGKDSFGNIYRTAGFTIGVTHLTDVPQIQENQNNFTVFPNPTNGETAIMFNHSVNNINIKVFNLVGQKMLEKTNVSGNRFNIDISDQTAGVYFVEVLVEGNVLRQKLVKE